MTIVELQPRDAPAPGTSYLDERHVLELMRETVDGWHGKPVDNPACSVLFYPRYAWKEVNRS